jgi:predicted RNase H-like HicB family nuclease
VGQGGATWGHTQQEALSNIHEVIQMVVESMMEQGEALPTEPADQVQVSGEPQVAVVV